LAFDILPKIAVPDNSSSSIQTISILCSLVTKWPQKWIFSIFGLDVTLTFDLKTHRFIFALKGL